MSVKGKSQRVAAATLGKLFALCIFFSVSPWFLPSVSALVVEPIAAFSFLFAFSKRRRKLGGKPWSQH
jgi:hypothetical protein